MRTLLFLCILLPLQSMAVPKLFFNWANPYDRMCARGFDYAKNSETSESDQLKKSWSVELKNRLPEFQEKWEKDSPILFKTLLSEFKKDFSRTEYSVALSACAMAPSMPTPLVLNVSRYLKSYAEPKKPKDMKYFVDVVFHELLHILVEENISEEAVMAVKYKNEKQGVLSHIYLFAMQSLIYEKAGMGDLWKETREFMLQHGGAHQRAIEIMEKEGRDKVLKDVK